MADLVSDQIRARIARDVRGIDNTTKRIDREIEKLREQRETLLRVRRVLMPPRRRRSKPVDPARAAGPTAIEKIANGLFSVGRTTQAQLVKDTGLNSGTVSHALHALASEDPPRARRTGNSFRGSAEYVWLGDSPSTVIEVGKGARKARAS